MTLLKTEHEPLLDDLERASAAWLKLEKHLHSRIDALRRMNDTSRDPAATEKIRGRIAELKDLLAQVRPAPASIAEDLEH